MLYVGHFSFDSREPAATIKETEGGSFTCLVEAESVESAVQKFSDLVSSLDDSFEAFESVGDVFLDDIIEVKKLPDQGVLTRFEERTADGLGTISTTLLGVPPEFCVSYGWGREDQGDEDEGEYVAEPFVTFEE